MFGATILVLVLIAQFYIALFPIGGTGSPSERVEAFFLSYLAFPILIMFYIIGYAWKRAGPRKTSEIDLVTGRKCFETAEELNAWVCSI
jgi:amino acid transporter